MSYMRPQSAICLLALALVLSAFTNSSAQSPPEDTQANTTTGTITGHVSTENGQPLPDAVIYLRGSMPLFQPRTATTDAQGNFQVTGLDPLLYGITAVAPSYIPPIRDSERAPTYYRIGDSVSLTLIKGGVISGTVLSPSGEPMVQVPVRAVLIRDSNGQPPKFGFFQGQRSTDDRGIYRIYGLTPGTYVVSAGGNGNSTFGITPYASDAPTYSPSSTRDTAAEISVRAGEESNGVDIRYRGEPGHAISGVASGAIDPNSNAPFMIDLRQISNGAPMSSIFGFQPPNAKGFSFFGLADGEYDIFAQGSVAGGEILASETRRIPIKGADVSGVELVLKPFASIAGKVVLSRSEAPECRTKREPLLSETLVSARRDQKSGPKEQPMASSAWTSSQATPNKAGDFLLRNIAPGQYGVSTQFFAKYWYLKSILRGASSIAAAPPARGAAVERAQDLARTGLALKFGDRIKDVTVTLAEGAASLRGKVATADGENVPAGLQVYLVPAEREYAEDVLRFFSADVNADGTFVMNNLPPGRYFSAARVETNIEPQWQSKLRSPAYAEVRTQIRRVAEAMKAEIEFKPCRNVIDYSLSFKSH